MSQEITAYVTVYETKKIFATLISARKFEGRMREARHMYEDVDFED